MQVVKLISGNEIPVIAYGPDSVGSIRGYKYNRRTIIHRAKNKFNRIFIDEPKYIKAVQNSIYLGFRMIDYSASYGDGSLIAKAIENSGCRREDITIITRITNKAQYSGNIDDEFVSQLKGFHTDYIDILMFHWPVTGCFENTWMKMIQLKNKGYVRILGVANCHKHHLERIKEISGIFPEINQVEIHPLFTQNELRGYCKNHDIQIEAYTPTARHDDRLFNPPTINNIAKKHNKTPTQVVLRWHIQNGIIPVTRSLNYDHIKDNIGIFDFELTDDDMDRIDGLNINSRLRYDPDNCDFTAL